MIDTEIDIRSLNSLLNIPVLIPEPRRPNPYILRFSKALKTLWEIFMSSKKDGEDVHDMSKMLSQKGKKINVTLKKGITLHEVTVEYMNDNLVLFVLKNGEYKAAHPSEIEKVVE